MLKQELIEKTNEVLKRGNFEYFNFQTSVFDIFAKKGDKSFILKVVENIDGLSREISEELKKICYFSDSFPLLIGDHSSKEVLQDFVIYTRHNIPVFNPKALEKFLLEREILLIRNRGGYCVKIDGEKFKRKRLEMDLSINRLSKIMGISSRSLIKYEKNTNISIENAEKLEEILGNVISNFEPEFQKIELDLKNNSSLSKKLFNLGLNPLEFNKAPFDLCARNCKKKEKYIIKIQKNMPNKRTIEFLKSFQEYLTSSAFFIFEKKLRFDELPSITIKEFNNLKDREELRELLF